MLELHIIKDFISWLHYDRGISCVTLQDEFEGQGETQNGAYGADGDDRLARQLMLQLAWHDVRFPNYLAGLPGSPNTPTEFFVLEAGLNLLKGRVSLAETILPLETARLTLSSRS